MKMKTKRVLQVLSIAAGSALVCVPVSQLFLGDNIISVLMGVLFALYLTVRLVAAVTEKDVNGKLNIFAAVFIILLAFLALTGLENISYLSPISSSPSVEGVEEPTESVAPRTDVMSGTEPSSAAYQQSSPVEESSPLVPSSPASQLSSLPLEGEENPLQNEQTSPVSDTPSSISVIEEEKVAEVPVNAEEALITASPSAPVPEEAETATAQVSVSEAVETSSAEASVPEAAEVEARVPSAPDFVSEPEEAEVMVPSAPLFVSEPEETEEEVPSAPVFNAVEEEEGIAPSEMPLSDIRVTQTLVEMEEEREEGITESVPASVVVTLSSEVPSAPVFREEKATVLVPSAPLFTPEARFALIPDAPSFASRSVPVLVPAAPSSISVSQSVYDIVETPAVIEEEEDPWADFYFSDEDLSLEDGIYYFSLYVNDYLEGDIEIDVRDGEVYLSAYELESYISGYLEKESVDRVFSNRDEYYSVDYLSTVGVDVWADTSFFEVYLYLSSTDMPVTRLSIKGSSSKSVTRPISGAVTVNPVDAYVISSYSLSASTTVNNGKGLLSNLHYSLNSSNSVRLWDLFGSFGWGLTGSGKNITLSLGSYSFYRDFEDRQIRLRFGNVSSDAFSPTGTPVGIRVDKSAAYGTSTTKKRDDQMEILVEKDSDVVVYNQEREIYRKSLRAGRYVLEDFVLYSGSNEIKVVISPLDGSEESIEYYTIKYSSSLLEPGEMYWGSAFAFSRQKVDSSSERQSWQFDIPFLSGKKLRYDVSDFSASAYANIGIFDSLSANVQTAVKGKRGVYSYRISAEFTNLNALGTMKANVNYNRATYSSIYVRLSEQFNIASEGFVRGLTLSASFNKANLSAENGYTVMPSISLSGVAGIFSWAVGASGMILPYSLETSTWMVAPSLSFTLGKIGISLSSTISGNGSGNVTYSGRIGASMRIGGVSTSASTSGKDTSVSASYSGNSYALSGRVRTSDVTDYRQYSYGLDFSSYTSLFSYSLSATSSASLENVSLNGNMSFASVMANGLFSFASSVPSSFLLIKQKGALRGNKVSVAAAGSSESTVPSAYVGNILYSGLPSSGASNISIYSQAKGGFSSGSSFDIYIPDTKNRGYVITLEGDATYTVSGTVTLGDYVWRNGSSPLYTVDIDRDGVISLVATDEYAFTDRNGVYILSDLKEGTYGFDVRADNRWYLYIIRITDDLNPNLVTMVGEKESSSLKAPEVYYGVIETMNERQISTDEFWVELYGEV